MRRKTLLLAGLVATLLAALGLWRLADHDLAHWRSQTFDIQGPGPRISGTIWLPDGPAVAVLAVVHGDGPQDRTSGGGYAAMFNVLLERRIALAAWDKPGVGASQGNWLDQSMADRTRETRDVLRHLRRRFQGTPVGALGFSQAGWVLPALTRADADFLVLVGPAVSWQDQGDYYTGVRLRRDGLSEPEIQARLAEEAREDDRMFGPDATAADAPEGLPPDRWRFIRTNRDADARADLATLDLPLLAIWGQDDLNVDAARNAAIYRESLASRAAPTKIMIWPDATHGLLKSPAYNWQLTEDWSTFARLRYLVEGRHAFAPGVLGAIAAWISEVGTRP